MDPPLTPRPGNILYHLDALTRIKGLSIDTLEPLSSNIARASLFSEGRQTHLRCGNSLLITRDRTTLRTELRLECPITRWVDRSGRLHYDLRTLLVLPSACLYHRATFKSTGPIHSEFWSVAGLSKYPVCGTGNDGTSRPYHTDIRCRTCVHYSHVRYNIKDSLFHCIAYLDPTQPICSDDLTSLE